MELCRSFTLMKELDSQSQISSAQVESQIQGLLGKVQELSNEERLAQFKALSESFKDGFKYGEEKVALAMQTYDMVTPLIFSVVYPHVYRLSFRMIIFCLFRWIGIFVV